MVKSISWPWRVALLVVLLVGIILGVEYRSGLTKQQKSQTELSITLARISSETERVSEWVYKNSTKISKKTAIRITEEAFKCNHPTLLLSVFQAESEFSPTALSYAGAIGLGQIMWKSWGEDLKKAGIAKEARDLYDVEINIKATAFVLDMLLKNSGGDIQKTLAAYLGAHQKPYQDKIAYNFLNLSLMRGKA
jgi:hypothetical protein